MAGMIRLSIANTIKRLCISFFRRKNKPAAKKTENRNRFINPLMSSADIPGFSLAYLACIE